MSDVVISTKMTEFLCKKGWQNMRDVMKQSPIFHFDVTVSAGGLGDPFQFRVSHLRRVSVVASIAGGGGGGATSRSKALVHTC